MWKVDRKRCLREMEYISKCHRDLFLFLWGFTLVTEFCFQEFFQEALEAFIICYGDCSVSQTFLLLRCWIQVFDLKH